MKKVEAYIKTHRLDDVTTALHHIKGVSGMTAWEAHGFGRGRGGTEAHPTREMISDYVDTMKIEVVCADDRAQSVVTAIHEAAHTGLRGDGKVFITPVEQVIRISTGERADANKSQ